MENFSTFFVFHGQPPIAVVAMKDILIGLFVLGGIAVKASSPSPPVLRVRIWTSRDRWFIELALIALIYFIVDIARAGNLGESVHGLRDFLAPFIVLLIGTIVGSRAGFEIRLFVNFVAATLAVVMVFAIYQYFAFSIDDLVKYGVVDPKFALNPVGGYVQSDSMGQNLTTVRSIGVFDSSLILGIVSVMVILNSWIGWSWSKSTGKLLHGGVIALAFLALGASYSRASQVGLIVATLVLARSAFRRGRLVAISLVLIILPFGLLRTFNGSGLDLSTLGHIFAYVRAADLIRVRPLGYGISFAGMRPTQTGFDGDYLNVLLNVGPVGLILFLAAFRHFYRQAKLLSSSPHLQPISLGIRGMLIAYCLTMITLLIQPNGACRIIDLWIGVLLGYGLSHSKRRATIKPQVPKQPAQAYSRSEPTPRYI